ncbi:hypothetical protein [Flexibacterium corallicola]|uniref:hypothetical protein n=1 Tax=Flexibacterium corallicola TaxID=3037259 RepID=UPI00286F351E|nr:hypothetical protein [Pseudovibrio sp. M1P-2-3]
MGEKLDTLKDETEAAIWLFAEEFAQSTYGDYTVSAIKGFHYFRDRLGLEKFDSKLPPNLLFAVNGHGGDSPKTAQYKVSRSRLGIFSSGVSTISHVSSQVTQVDLAGVITSINATGSTAAHMKMLRDIARKYPKSKTIQDWIQVCMVAKAAKAAGRTTDLIGAAVPIGLVGTVTGGISLAMGMGLRLGYGTVISRTAMELHWRAYLEMRLGSLLHRNGKALNKPNGPASAVIFELLKRRGATRFLGQYDTAAIISEPAGWETVKDKLLLM